MGVSSDDDALSVDLADGRVITVPLAWYPRLLHATPKERANRHLAGGGHDISGRKSTMTCPQKDTKAVPRSRVATSAVPPLWQNWKRRHQRGVRNDKMNTSLVRKSNGHYPRSSVATYAAAWPPFRGYLEI